MAIEKVYLDPNAATYTDDEIVGKVNTATANITRAGSIEGTAASALDSDDIGEGTSNLYDTGVPATDLADLDSVAASKLGNIEDSATADQTGAEVRDAIVGLGDNDREILISRPTTGQKKVYAIQTHTDGKQEIEQSDTAES